VSKKVLIKRGCGKVKGSSVDAETNKTESNKCAWGACGAYKLTCVAHTCNERESQPSEVLRMTSERSCDHMSH
jgi:hypothetical protein